MVETVAMRPETSSPLMIQIRDVTKEFQGDRTSSGGTLSAPCPRYCVFVSAKATPPTRIKATSVRDRGPKSAKRGAEEVPKRSEAIIPPKLPS